jgi:CBS domain-containing protein
VARAARYALLSAAPAQEAALQVRDAMSTVVLSVGPTHTLRQVAQAMSTRKVGAAVVSDPDADGPGILTERDVLEAVAAGEDLDIELAAQHLTREAVVADPSWPLVKAAQAMLAGGFRHLVVTERGEVVGVLSVRDLVRVWSADRNDG